MLETREDIKARMIEELAREWDFRGKGEIDLDRFDPLVDLLLSACAYGLEQVSNEIYTSQSRIFERLVEILIPDAMNGAQPAHAVVMANPVEPTYITHAEDLCFYKHPEIKKDLFFSPAGNFKLTQGKVALMAYGRQLFQVNKRLEKDLVSESVYGKTLQSTHLYLGIELHEEISTLDGISFFFDWKNEPRAREFLQLLSLARWFLNGRELVVRSGIQNTITNEAESDDIFEAVGIEKQAEQLACDYYESNFVQIFHDTREIRKDKKVFPLEFGEVFGENELKSLKEKIIWIRIEVPEALKAKIKGMECFINCFPVLNRRLYEETEKLQEKLNIISLERTDGYYFSMEEVGSANAPYSQVPLRYFDERTEGLYALRSGGVKRFDRRDASRMLRYLVDLVQDESVAFKAATHGNLSKDLEELNQVLERLKKGNKDRNLSNSTFVFLRPYKEDKNIFIKYWMTEGELANRVPTKVALSPYGTHNLQANSIFSITSSKNGRAPLKTGDSIQAFKEAIMTRGRIVTAEDIKAFCLSRIGGDFIKRIEVKKGVQVGPESKTGLIRVINVLIYPKMVGNPTPDEWIELCYDMENLLNRKSSSIHPIKIILSR